MNSEEQGKITLPGPIGHGVYHCHKCGWPFPKPPFARQRRSHKRICGTIDGYRPIDADAKSHSSDEDTKTPRPKVLGIGSSDNGGSGSGKRSNKSEDEVFEDAAMELPDSVSTPGSDGSFERVSTDAWPATGLISEASDLDVIHRPENQRHSSQMQNMESYLCGLNTISDQDHVAGIDIDSMGSLNSDVRAIYSEVKLKNNGVSPKSVHFIPERKVVDSVVPEDLSVESQNDVKGPGCNSIKPETFTDAPKGYISADNVVQYFMTYSGVASDAKGNEVDGNLANIAIPGTEQTNHLVPRMPSNHHSSEAESFQHKDGFIFDITSREQVPAQDINVGNEDHKSMKLDLLLNSVSGRTIRLEDDINSPVSKVAVSSFLSNNYVESADNSSIDACTWENALRKEDEDSTAAVESPSVEKGCDRLELKVRCCENPQSDGKQASMASPQSVTGSEKRQNACSLQEVEAHNSQPDSEQMILPEAKAILTGLDSLVPPIDSEVWKMNSDAGDHAVGHENYLTGSCDMVKKNGKEVVTVENFTLGRDKIPEIVTNFTGNQVHLMTILTEGKDMQTEETRTEDGKSAEVERGKSDKDKHSKMNSTVFCESTYSSEPQYVTDVSDTTLRNLKDIYTSQVDSFSDLCRAGGDTTNMKDVEAHPDLKNSLDKEVQKDIKDVEIYIKREGHVECASGVSGVDKLSQCGGVKLFQNSSEGILLNQAILSPAAAEFDGHSYSLIEGNSKGRDSALNAAEAHPDLKNFMDKEIQKDIKDVEIYTKSEGQVECAGGVSRVAKLNQYDGVKLFQKSSEGILVNQAILSPANAEFDGQRFSPIEDNSEGIDSALNAARKSSGFFCDAQANNIAKQRGRFSTIDTPVDSGSQTDSLEVNPGSVSVVSPLLDAEAVISEASPSNDFQTSLREENLRTLSTIFKESDTFKRLPSITLAEPRAVVIPKADPPSRIPQMPEPTSLKTLWFPSPVHIAGESPEWKKNEDINAKVTNWSATPKQRTNLKNLLSEDEMARKDDSAIVDVAKTWDSPLRYPAAIKREKRKLKGRSYWAQFLCCSSSKLDTSNASV